MVIISNNVYADVKNGEYKLLDNEFIGTFVTMSFEVPAINLLTTAVTLGVTVYVAKIILRKLLAFGEPINEPIKLVRIDL